MPRTALAGLCRAPRASGSCHLLPSLYPPYSSTWSAPVAPMRRGLSSAPPLLSGTGGQQGAVGRHIVPEGLAACGVTDLAGLAVQAGASDLQHLCGTRIASR